MSPFSKKVNTTYLLDRSQNEIISSTIEENKLLFKNPSKFC